MKRMFETALAMTLATSIAIAGGPIYKLIKAGEIIAFPDEFAGKRIAMVCVPLSLVQKDKVWETTLDCLDSYEPLSTRNLIEQDIEVIVHEKEIAKKIYPSIKKSPLFIVGHFRKNSGPVYRYVFTIDTADELAKHKGEGKALWGR